MVGLVRKVTLYSCLSNPLVCELLMDRGGLG